MKKQTVTDQELNEICRKAGISMITNPPSFAVPPKQKSIAHHQQKSNGKKIPLSPEEERKKEERRIRQFI